MLQPIHRPCKGCRVAPRDFLSRGLDVSRLTWLQVRCLLSAPVRAGGHGRGCDCICGDFNEQSDSVGRLEQCPSTESQAGSRR